MKKGGLGGSDERTTRQLRRLGAQNVCQFLCQKIWYGFMHDTNSGLRPSPILCRCMTSWKDEVDLVCIVKSEAICAHELIPRRIHAQI